MRTYRGRDGFVPAETGSSFRRGGGTANGVWNCCLLLLMVPLVLVCGFWVWVWLAPIHYRHEARDDMTHRVTLFRARLARDAADGTLLDTEIDRDLAGAGSPGGASSKLVAARDVRRSGRTVTVTSGVTGAGPGFMTPTEVTGCYRFRVVPPAVSVQQVSDRICRDLPYGPARPSAQVADDVVVELRAALARGGPGAAARADVWSTHGIWIARQETAQGRLTTLAWLMRQGDPSPGDCYEFRAQEDPVSVTAKKLTPQACHRTAS